MRHETWLWRARRRRSARRCCGSRVQLPSWRGLSSWLLRLGRGSGGGGGWEMGVHVVLEGAWSLLTVPRDLILSIERFTGRIKTLALTSFIFHFRREKQQHHSTIGSAPLGIEPNMCIYFDSADKVCVREQRRINLLPRSRK